GSGKGGGKTAPGQPRAKGGHPAGGGGAPAATAGGPTGRGRRMTTGLGDPILLKSHTAEELHARLAGLGVTARLARRLQTAVIRRGEDEIPSELPEVSPRLLARVRAAAAVPRLTLCDKAVSPRDGFTKYLFRGDGPEPFEAVRIPLRRGPGAPKSVCCAGARVGGALGCAFCATARLGFRRNLATWEIVDQVVRVQADSPPPVRGVVFMGMGEPM